MQKKKKVGWIGLGNLGLAMAKRLLSQGFDVTVCKHVRSEPVAEMRALGAQESRDPKGVAQVCDIVFSMVRDVDQTEEALFSPNGVWKGIKQGSILVLSSTLTPHYCQEVDHKAKEKGISLLDAPVSGGGARGAAVGDLTFLVGGEPDTLERCRDGLEAMGKNIFHLGPVGTGQVAKLANNLIFWANTLAVGEAIQLAEKAGLNHRVLLEAVKTCSGNSWVVENWDHICKLAEESVLRLLDKDIQLALDLAASVQLKLPLSGLTRQMGFPQFALLKAKR